MNGLVQHPHMANDFNFASYEHLKNKEIAKDRMELNPTLDNYMPISETQLTDGARSFERVFKVENAGRAITANREFQNPSFRRRLVSDIESLSEVLINDGLDPVTGDYMSMKDLQSNMAALAETVKDFGTGAGSIITRQVITRSIEKLPEEGTIHQYFTKKLAVRTNEEIILPAIGSVANASLDMGPNTEPHILSVSTDAAMVAKCGRSGIAVHLQHEAIRLSKFNLLKLYLTEAKNSLRRWKDIKAVRQTFNGATTLFDNLAPEDSVLGATTCRSFKDSTLNGSFTLKDFFAMFLYGIEKGIYCDTVLVSTIGWMVFMNDPIMKNFIEKNGGVIFRGPQGTIGMDLDPYRAMISGTRPEKTHITPSIPSGLMNVNFRFIVTPFVPFYSEGQTIYKNLIWTKGVSQTPYTVKEGSNAGQPVKCGKDKMTNLIMLDSSKAVLHLEEEQVKTAEENDMLREFHRIHLTERYDFALMYDGAGVLVARNIVVTDDTLDIYNYISVSLTEAQTALQK